MRIVSNAPFDQSLPSVVEVSQLYIVAFTCTKEIFLLIYIHLIIIIRKVIKVSRMVNLKVPMKTSAIPHYQCESLMHNGMHVIFG